jgi:hypothetical protein
MDEVSYSVVSAGNSEFIRAFSIPLAEELERTEGLRFRAFPNAGILERDTRSKANEALVQGIIGVLLVIPSWLAWKVADEIYEIKIRPKVRELIKKADSIDIFSSTSKHKVVTLEVLEEKANVLIILAAKEKSLEQLELASEKLNGLLPIAVRYIEEHASQNEVHLYFLHEGKANLEPLIHKNVELAHRALTHNTHPEVD